MVGYIYLNTDLKTGKQYAGKHHYHIEGQLDPSYHGSGVLWMKVLKKRPKELIKEEYIKTCYSEEEMNSDEQYYIEFFDTLYPNGYNLTKGGDGGLLCEETKHKISEAHKGKTLSEEHRRKLIESLKGKPAHNKGVPMSEETRKKLSESRKGKLHSEESKKKISESHKGKLHSEETRKKLSELHKGKHLSEEQLEKRKGLFVGEKNPMYGKKHSEETKKKISEAAKRRFMLKQMQPDGCLPLW